MPKDSASGRAQQVPATGQKSGTQKQAPQRRQATDTASGVKEAGRVTSINVAQDKPDPPIPPNKR